MSPLAKKVDGDKENKAKRRDSIGSQGKEDLSVIDDEVSVAKTIGTNIQKTNGGVSVQDEISTPRLDNAKPAAMFDPRKKATNGFQHSSLFKTLDDLETTIEKVHGPSHAGIFQAASREVEEGEFDDLDMTIVGKGPGARNPSSCAMLRKNEFFREAE